MKFNLDIPKIGYFLVYKDTKKFLSKLIAEEQRNEGFSKEDSEYIHVELSGGEQSSISAKFPYVQMVDILKEHKGEYVKIVKYKASNYYIKRYKVAFFGATQCNLLYGLLSAIWFKINHKFFTNYNIFAFDKTPTCSFLCANALKKVYPDSFEDISKVLPAHFLDEDKFAVVWEGYIT